jgi:hypothetical protein
MLYVCTARFNVTENLEFFLDFDGIVYFKKFYKIGIVALLFVFDKYFPIIYPLGSKDSSYNYK